MLLLLAATWLVGMPALVGQYVRAWVPEWLADIEATEDSHFEPGWFRSDLEVSPGNDIHARLKARHMPPIGLSWLYLDGEIDTPHSAEPTRIQGRLDLNGRVRLIAEGRELTFSQQPHMQTQSLEINLDQRPEGKTRLQTELTGLAWTDGIGNQLDFDKAVTVMNWQALGSDHASLEVSASFNHLDQLKLDLTIQASPLEVNVLGQLIEGIRQLIAAPPDSMTRQMALLTIAGSWQELTQHGLEIEIKRLTIGSSTEFFGRWITAAEMPRLTGHGHTDDLIELLTPIIALIHTVPPARAERETHEWIQAMVREQVLEVNENGAFRFQYPPDEGPV